MTTGSINYSPDYKSKSSYTDAQITHSLAQELSRTGSNPAVATEHERLERRVLACARKWFAASIAERAFSSDFELRTVLYDLLLFEGRHGLTPTLIDFESQIKKQ